MSDTPRTDAHTRQLIDALQHPHWIEFARKLERENAELRADGICRRRGIPTKEESVRIKNLEDHIEKLWKENAALRADKERLDWLEKQCVFMNLKHSPGVYSRFLTTRDEIDAERKEAQP